MKKRLKYFWPLFFALFSFAIYILLYRPPLGSEDFITALLVFFAALGWSAEIFLAKENSHPIYYIYISFMVVLPLFIALLSRGENMIWQVSIIGLIVLAAVLLRLFISGYFEYKKTNE